MELKDLNPHPENPRRITDEKLKMLDKSLKAFGDLSGFVFNRRTGRLISGHQRQKVLPPDAKIIMEPGSEDRGHILLDGDRFSVRFVDWDETKEKAANVAANAHGGEWDRVKLIEWIHELDSMNIDIDLLGFETHNLEQLMAPIIKKDDFIEEEHWTENYDGPEERIRLIITFENKEQRQIICNDLGLMPDRKSHNSNTWSLLWKR